MSTIAIQDWTAVDADDRYPGEFTAYLTRASVAGHDFFIRITPGNPDRYRAPGFHTEIDDHGYGINRQSWSLHTDTVEEAKARIPAELEAWHADRVAALIADTLGPFEAPKARLEATA